MAGRREVVLHAVAGERLDQAIDTATTGPWEEGVYIMPMLGSGFGADIESDGQRLVIGAPGENKVYVYAYTPTSG